MCLIKHYYAPLKYSSVCVLFWYSFNEHITRRKQGTLWKGKENNQNKKWKYRLTEHLFEWRNSVGNGALNVVIYGTAFIITLIDSVERHDQHLTIFVAKL